MLNADQVFLLDHAGLELVGDGSVVLVDRDRREFKLARGSHLVWDDHLTLRHAVLQSMGIFLLT